MRVGIAVVVLVAVGSFAQADDTLQNDGFQSGDMAVAEGGFAVGEIAASRFVAPDAARQLLQVQLIFGGGSGSAAVTLVTWDDSAGTTDPGTMLSMDDFQLTGSDSALQEMDVSSENIIVPQQFRVGIQFQAAGYPSVMRDNDGTIAADKNYIDANGVGWAESQSLGVQGDWIIRAVVSGSGGASDAGVTVDAGGDVTCTGNGGCPVGEYCDTTAHSCTFDCRTASDCGGGGATCNSLGMCVNGERGGGGGCCRADTGSGSGAAALAIGVLGVLQRRRRARR
ncbi:MAG TPA: hypothetical protein VGF94_06180 [Kofleriaceae bacterium]|jgi:hypothetical protein